MKTEPSQTGEQEASAPPQPSERPDLYSELAEALGCDVMDSHAGRLEIARKSKSLRMLEYERRYAAPPQPVPAEPPPNACEGLIRATERAVLAAALPQPPGSPPPLPKPARPARYYCNKCGAYPESDVHMAFRPTLSKRCHYLAAEIDPATYTADQMREYAAQAVASLPASSIAPPKSDVHLVGSQGHVLDAAS
jgi:hypothetical protein